MNIKAIVIGSFVTIIILLGGQLAYILLASYVGSAATDNVLVGEFKELIWFYLSLAAYSVCFFIGGLFTSLLTEERKIFHGSMVGFIVAGGSVLLSADLSDLNYKAVILVTIGLCFAAWGGKAGLTFETKNQDMLKTELKEPAL